jgi:tetratricopeptide (TPR) repeat protein
MNEFEFPNWTKRLQRNYEADPVRWMWISMTALVVVLAIGMVFYMVRKQKQEASELLTKGMQALDQGNYVSAQQNFERIEKSMRFSGMGDEAKIFSAAALFGLERYAESEKAYRDFRSAAPSSDLAPEAELGIGACLEMKGDTAGALAVYRAALEKYRNSFLAKALETRVARLARQTGDTPTAAEVYDRLEGDSEGLWREISRGNRRLILSHDAMLAPPAGVPALPAAAAETSAASSAPPGR